MIRFTLGTVMGEPRAVRVGYKGEEIRDWIEQHPQQLWHQVGYVSVTNVYILDEQLYTMFLLKWGHE
jgi:hypothetical protein